MRLVVSYLKLSNAHTKNLKLCALSDSKTKRKNKTETILVSLLNWLFYDRILSVAVKVILRIKHKDKCFVSVWCWSICLCTDLESKLGLRLSSCTCAYALWITLCQTMCHLPLQYVRVCVCPSVLRCLALSCSLSDSIWRRTNWQGASTSTCFVGTWRPRCWINKSWSSKFCHMSGHVFPSTSWEQSVPCLSN